MQHIPWGAFRRALTRFDRDKIHPSIAIRNTVGVVLPLVIAAVVHQRALGLVGSLGALNVAYSDGEDAVGTRIRRMSLAASFIALALFIGGLTGKHNAIAVLIAAAFAFAAGMLTSLGTAAGDIGTISLVTLVVFASRPLTPAQAALSGLVAFAGAMLQTALSFLFDPVRRLAEQQRVLAGVYRELGDLALTEHHRGTPPPATATFTKAHDLLLEPAQTPEGERLRSLFSQAERIRLRILALRRLRKRLRRDPAGEAGAKLLDRFLEVSSAALYAIAVALETGLPAASNFAADSERIVHELRTGSWDALSTFSRALLRECASQVDAIAGQIRAAARLAAAEDFSAPVPISVPNSNTEAKQPNTLLRRLRNAREVLSANLTIRSSAFRHALRLAVCVAIGDVIGRAFDWQRSYWIPMTIAIVLKPDFISTYSRGILRLAGTFVGLILATVVFYALPQTALRDIVFVGAFTLILRWIGPANYGIFVIAVSGLVVALIANTGVAPHVVIPIRAFNTAIGGALALLAYAAWPTWERAQFGESFANLLDAYRAYLRALRETYMAAEAEPDFAAVDRARQSARVARTNVEASADRLGMEPGASPTLLRLTNGMLASSHDFIYAAMALEGAALIQSPLGEHALDVFLNRLDLTLYLLGAALREPGRQFRRRDPGHFPDMRAEYRTLMESLTEAHGEQSFLGVEADRMTNALNTLREQGLEWLQLTKAGSHQTDFRQALSRG